MCQIKGDALVTPSEIKLSGLLANKKRKKSNYVAGLKFTTYWDTLWGDHEETVT